MLYVKNKICFIARGVQLDNGVEPPYVIPMYTCRPHIALLLIEASRWPIEIVKHDIFLILKTFIF